jgi:hypothetical protein
MGSDHNHGLTGFTALSRVRETPAKLLMWSGQIGEYVIGLANTEAPV